MPRLFLLGTGLAGSLRRAPAGLLLEYGAVRLGFDGGPGSEPPEHVHAWLVCDIDEVAMPELRRLAMITGMPTPGVAGFDRGHIHAEPLPTVTGAYGYRIRFGTHLVSWVPVAESFPDWAEGSEVMFADASTPERIERLAVEAEQHQVKRLVYVRLGDVALARMAAGRLPPFGEWGEEGRLYRP